MRMSIHMPVHTSVHASVHISVRRRTGLDGFDVMRTKECDAMSPPGPCRARLYIGIADGMPVQKMTVSGRGVAKRA